MTYLSLCHLLHTCISVTDCKYSLIDLPLALFSSASLQDYQRQSLAITYKNAWTTICAMLVPMLERLRSEWYPPVTKCWTRDRVSWSLTPSFPPSFPPSLPSVIAHLACVLSHRNAGPVFWRVPCPVPLPDKGSFRVWRNWWCWGVLLWHACAGVWIRLPCPEQQVILGLRINAFISKMWFVHVTVLVFCMTDIETVACKSVTFGTHVFNETKKCF